MNAKSIEYVLRRMGITEVKQNGEWLTTTCPLAPWTHAGGTDSRPSFGIHEATGVSGVHCFSCGFKGGVLSLVQQYGRHAVKDGIWSEEDLQQMQDFVILAEDEDKVDRPSVPTKDVEVPEDLTSYLKVYHEYFEERGITRATARLWNLGYVDMYENKEAHIYLDNRALFPVYAKSGLQYHLKGIVGRSTIGEEPKYKNAPPDFKKVDYVYGGWLVGEHRVIIVVEGPVDAIKVNQQLIEHGLDGMFAVSLLGASPGEPQIAWLKAHADEVICMLDNDPSGMLGTKKLIDALEAHLIVSVVAWDEAFKDPDEAGAAIIGMIENRETVLEHRLRRLLNK